MNDPMVPKKEINKLVQDIKFYEREWVDEFIEALAKMNLSDEAFLYVSRMLWQHARMHGQFRLKREVIGALYRLSVYGESPAVQIKFYQPK